MSLPRPPTSVSSRLFWLARAFFVCLLLAALATRPNLPAQPSASPVLLLIPAGWLTAWLLARWLEHPRRPWRWGVAGLSR
ncbi:MAG: hypothetical protein KIS63_21985, partial [Caldilineales bacterium]|nr:hypothetical protein [Caldilineales bacterium]